jgi:hypothetical protein
MTEIKRIKAKKRTDDYKKKMKANKRLSGKFKVYVIKGKKVFMRKRQPSLTSGDGILPKSRKYSKSKKQPLIYSHYSEAK